jgi:hypothetical protein
MKGCRDCSPQRYGHGFAVAVVVAQRYLKLMMAPLE